ncbi:MAG: putative ATP-grasp-modified RiPP [Pseudonocardiales bacterium]|nr:putative ATP-grasp-modified RiPP [Pseudonocardiales bacterium]
MSPLVDHPDSLFPATTGFPLGRPVLPAQDTTVKAGKVTVPLALRYAVVPAQVEILDLEEVGYDEERQIGVVRQGDVLIPLLRRSIEFTATDTAKRGGQPDDTDRDYTED